MIGFAKKSTFIAILLFSATVAYAGDLRPAPQGGSNMHPAPQGSKDTALLHVTSQTAIDAINKENEDKLRRLRPVK
jgi:hypothetical protein